MNKLMTGTLVLIFTLMFALTGQVFAADLSVKIETPKSTTRENSFKIGFVTLDIQGRSVTVKCLKKGPSEGSFTQFGSDFVFAGGGNSGNCEVTSSIISSQGTYQFKVTAQAGAEEAESSTVSVSYATDSPSTPSYSKEQLSSCDYKIKFKTADDGRTAKVKIYRSTATSFTADSSTEIGTVNIGPNLEGSFTNSVPDCSKTYYFAIRAFDDAGNGSGVASDNTVTVITTTTTVAASPTPGGAIPVAESQVSEGSILGSTAAASEEGVLGEEASPGSEISASPTPLPQTGPFTRLFSLRNLIYAALAALVIYFLYRRSRK